MTLTQKFPTLAGIADPRTRTTLTPARIVHTAGDVHGAHYLTERKPVQVNLNMGTDACTLKNTAEGAHAAVLLDFGRELHGSLNVSVWRESVSDHETLHLRIRLGESVTEALTPVGERGTTNDHATRDFVLPVSFLSSNETPESGFRFAYVELCTPNAEIHLRAVTATLIVRDLSYLGSFTSDDERLGEIYDTAAYTVHLNMQRYLWDGIKRDRLVWAGDMNTEVNTILAVFGGAQCDVVERSLDFCRDTTPAGEAMNTIQAYTMWWLICHYDWYMATGNYAYLVEQKPYMIAVLQKYLTKIDENGSETMGGMFDWPSEGHPEMQHAGRQGLFRMALTDAAELMRYLGESELSLVCTRAADSLLRHNPDPHGYKQAAAMLSLSGIADPAAMCSGVILPGGARGLSTFLAYYTLSALGEAGLTAEAVHILRDYYGGMLDLGATTFWEDFDLSWAENAHRIDELPVPGKHDPHGDYGAFCYKNFRHSLCHGWSSGPAPFLTKYVLGVRPFAPGMRAVRFAPDLGDLKWARGTVPTPHGVIEVELEKAANGRTLRKIHAPDGVEVVSK